MTLTDEIQVRSEELLQHYSISTTYRMAQEAFERQSARRATSEQEERLRKAFRRGV